VRRRIEFDADNPATGMTLGELQYQLDKTREAMPATATVKVRVNLRGGVRRLIIEADE
jgi:hypothetical protein